MDQLKKGSTLLSLIKQLLLDNNQYCTGCKKEIMPSDVYFYLFNFHNTIRLINDDCLACFKKQNDTQVALYFDRYELHESCYQTLCMEIEKTTCAQCTEKTIKKNNQYLKSNMKKSCKCCSIA